jgi:2-polyprenyl-3-methyl-5-hydroxy-6-metoxy-1,4-benzoquinol methylase
MLPEARRAALHSAAERRLQGRDAASAVRALHEGLTGARALAGRPYLDEPRLLAGYLLHFFPRSYVAARIALAELPAFSPRARVLDVGAGPGALGIASLDHIGDAEVTACDRSAAALAALQEIEPRVRVLRREAGDLPPGRFHLVMAGHLFNELPFTEHLRLSLQLAATLAPGGVLLLIEPALKRTGRALLELRDAMLREGFSALAPCIFQGPCPALAKTRDWCHSARETDAPFADLAERAGLRGGTVKFAYVALARVPARAPAREGAPLFRVVSESLLEKGRLRLWACGDPGRFPIVRLNADATPANEPFGDLRRGDLFVATRLEPRGDGLRITKESAVTVIRTSGDQAG